MAGPICRCQPLSARPGGFAPDIKAPYTYYPLGTPHESMGMGFGIFNIVVRHVGTILATTLLTYTRMSVTAPGMEY